MAICLASENNEKIYMLQPSVNISGLSKTTKCHIVLNGKILSKAKAYSTSRKLCNLCIEEKIFSSYIDLTYLR